MTTNTNDRAATLPTEAEAARNNDNLRARLIADTKNITPNGVREFFGFMNANVMRQYVASMGDPMLAAMSILSDAQEWIDRDDDSDDAGDRMRSATRILINRAKWIIEVASADYYAR